jgi:hypothetical protein
VPSAEQRTPKEETVIFVTTYKVKPFLSKAETRKVLEVFAREGAGPGTTAHYVAADGSHGVVISDTDDVAGAYRNLQNYTEWVEYDANVMLKVEEAVPLIMESLG